MKRWGDVLKAAVKKSGVDVSARGADLLVRALVGVVIHEALREGRQGWPGLGVFRVHQGKPRRVLTAGVWRDVPSRRSLKMRATASANRRLTKARR